MSCGPEPEQNLAKALERVADAAGRGAQVVCLPELFQTQYFCQREDHSLFDLAEPIPGPASDLLSAAARQHGVVLIASLFEKARSRRLSQYRRHLRFRRFAARLYRKMHIPDDPLYYEKFYFTPGDLGSAPSIPPPAAWARSSAGTNGSPRARGSRRCRERPCFSILPPSAGIPRRRPSSECRSTTPGAPFNAPRHRKRSLCCGGESSRIRDRQRPRKIHARPWTRILGRIVFLRIPSAASSPKPRTTRRNPGRRRGFESA